MPRKDLGFYAIILVLAALLLWQWLSKADFAAQIAELEKDSKDLHLLSGIGPLRSAHLHADVKVYINGNTIDLSQQKYQLAARYLHFEEGIGDVIHTHAAGLTIGYMFSSLGIDFDSNCIRFESQSYCNDGNKKLKFYVNGQPNNRLDNYLIRNLDRILVSYGAESEAEIQKQLSSVTNLAPDYSAKNPS